MRMRIIGIIVCLLTAINAGACTIFSFTADGVSWFASNEDYLEPGVIWFTPGKKNRYGRVNFGFKTDFAQCSINEKGLAFDAAALQEVPWAPDPGKKTVPNLLELIMDRCATVNEALALFESYNCRHLAAAQFLFADASGDSAVVTRMADGSLSVVRGGGGLLICTNSRLESSAYRCRRFVKAEQIFRSHPGAPREAARDSLEAVHQKGAGFTSYSVVGNLSDLTFTLYNLGNFTEAREFDLLEELNKGKSAHKLKELFQSSPSLESVRQGPRAYDTEIALDPAVLKSYAGRYAPEGVSGVALRIEQRGTRLAIGREDEEKRTELFVESEDTFRFEDDSGQIRFRRGAEGEVVGLLMSRGGGDHRALRLPE